jgi:hypothetical protein
MMLPSVVKKSPNLIHKFNFNAREHAAGAITVSTVQAST